MFKRPNPVCQTCGGVLVAFELEGVEIDRCVECGGTWLDAGEIERISAMSRADPGPLSQSLARAASGAKSKRECPRCARALRSARIRAESGGKPGAESAARPRAASGDKPGAGPETGACVEIDRCPAGHGYWFDPGEMRQLIQMFDQGEEGAVARFFQDMFGAELK
jgi:Zn-finger nucleic acid-binding protein